MATSELQHEAATATAPHNEEHCEMAQPQKEHQWLQQLVGEWTCEAECTMEPGKPPEKMTGTESVRSLGGLWVIAEGQGELPGGGSMTSVMTLGYDPQKGRFVGTWLGSVLTFLFVYDGELDASERVLSLAAEGPSMAGDGSMAQYKDVIEIKSADHRVLTSHVLGADGQWTHFMTAHYRRTR